MKNMRIDKKWYLCVDVEVINDVKEKYWDNAWDFIEVKSYKINEQWLFEEVEKCTCKENMACHLCW